MTFIYPKKKKKLSLEYYKEEGNTSFKKIKIKDSARERAHLHMQILQNRCMSTLV